MSRFRDGERKWCFGLCDGEERCCLLLMHLKKKCCKLVVLICIRRLSAIHALTSLGRRRRGERGEGEGVWSLFFFV